MRVLQRLAGERSITATRIRCLAVLIALTSMLGGCRPALSASELQSLADAAVVSLLKEARVNTEETVFSVKAAAERGKVTLAGKTSDAALKESLLSRILAIEGAEVIDEVVVLPAPALGDKTFGIVKSPVANLGDGPKSSGGKHTVTQARMGDVVKVLEEKEGWYLVQMDDHYLGWADPADIRLCDKDALDAYWSGRVVLVNARTAPVVDKATGERLFERDLVQGSVLTVAGLEGQWTRVALPDGREGWIGSALVTRFDRSLDVFSEKKGPEGVVETAIRYVGVPYLWGGTTAYGFDCSGFTQFCCRMNGYRIRRDADMQYEQGEPVNDRKNLRPGDLVFFETYARGASHVGIYLGDSRYVQSGGSTGVTIVSFDPAHEDYSRSLDAAYLGARRIIK